MICPELLRDYDCSLLTIATAWSWAKSGYDARQNPKWRPESIVETKKEDDIADEMHCWRRFQSILGSKMVLRKMSATEYLTRRGIGSTQNVDSDRRRHQVMK